MSTWVLIPALNAEATLDEALRGVRRVLPEATILVIDDGSNDATSEIAARLGARTIRHSSNEGIGRSLQDGAALALEQGATTFVTVGADLQRVPEDIPRLLQALTEPTPVELVVGSKLMGQPQRIPLFRNAANRFLRALFNGVFSTGFTDVTSGFRAFGRRVASDLAGLDSRYGFDIDLRIRALEKSWSTREIPVRVIYHRHSTRMRCSTWVGVRLAYLIVRRRNVSAP